MKYTLLLLATLLLFIVMGRFFFKKKGLDINEQCIVSDDKPLKAMVSDTPLSYKEDMVGFGLPDFDGV